MLLTKIFNPGFRTKGLSPLIESTIRVDTHLYLRYTLGIGSYSTIGMQPTQVTSENGSLEQHVDTQRQVGSDESSYLKLRSKFIRQLMRNGKKSVATKIFDQSLDHL